VGEGKQKAANRLIKEASPYLLQHAHNPVDWYPWSAQAFERARKENKPVFLSIGYSTCHWCHVMAEESFQNEHIAEILNAHFISIKVDREERPDLDEVYMSAVQAIAGSGGWPLSVFLSPEAKPFYGGTYFPPKDTAGRPGFEKVLLLIRDAWVNRRGELIDSADNITKMLSKSMVRKELSQLPTAGAHLIDEAFAHIEIEFDSEYGGFGSGPKFPSPCYLSFLLCCWWRTGNEKALKMVTKTLDCMMAGGIYDHIGGGFHRYATDRRWLMPHFEKMLYDQALISRCYLQAWQITKNPGYAAVVAETLDYVLRDMRDKSGGFYSAEDADSEGREGTFYLWTPEEVEQVLVADDGGIFNRYYTITDEGNFEGKNILSRRIPIDELNRLSERDIELINQAVSRGKPKLLARRNERIRPGRDEKIIVGWNGLMIESLARAGAAMQQQRYVDAAGGTANFIFDTLLQNGRLMHYWREGKVIEKGYLDDYAALIAAMIALYEATFDAGWLAFATELADRMIELFEDKEQGGFFLNGSDSEKLIIFPKPSYDGAIPGGNSMAAEALLKLGRLTMNETYTEKATDVLRVFSKRIADTPTSLTQMLVALNFQLGPAQEIVIAPGQEKEKADKMLRLLQSSFVPNAVIILHDSTQIEETVPFVKTQTAIANKATAYVCDNYVCKQPITELAEFEKAVSDFSAIRE
jgi:uncharacterized protein YyaL (SSP411 family)